MTEDRQIKERLNEAAPELYRVLKAVLTEFTEGALPEPYKSAQELFEDAYRVLRKAEGK